MAKKNDNKQRMILTRFSFLINYQVNLTIKKKRKVILSMKYHAMQFMLQTVVKVHVMTGRVHAAIISVDCWEGQKLVCNNYVHGIYSLQLGLFIASKLSLLNIIRQTGCKQDNNELPRRQNLFMAYKRVPRW